MRYISNIHLERVTFHIVGNRDGRPPLYASQDFSLSADRRVRDYLVKHIRQSLDDPQTRGAYFASSSSVPATVCGETISGTCSLVDGSRQLAERLHEIILGNQRIDPGDLAICLFCDGDRADGPRYLALLKLDPTETYRLVRRTDINGSEYADLEITDDGLPGKDARLHKCAFVQQTTSPEEYGLFLLDRQVRPDQERVVARFFAERFLEAVVDEDRRRHTQRLRTGLVNARNAVGKAHGEEAARTVDTLLQMALSSETFDVDTQISQARINDAAKAQTLAEVRKLVANREVQIDEAYARDQLQRRRRFVGSYGLIVSMQSDHYIDVVKSAEKVPSADGADFYRIVLETENWDERNR